MRRMIAVLAVGLMAATLTAGVAGASPATKTEKRARHWYAVAGERRTETSAKELLAEVEKKHEVKRLREAGFGARTAHQRG